MKLTVIFRGHSLEQRPLRTVEKKKVGLYLIYCQSYSKHYLSLKSINIQYKFKPLYAGTFGSSSVERINYHLIYVNILKDLIDLLKLCCFEEVN